MAGGGVVKRVEGRHFLVLGLGKSGKAAKAALERRGAVVDAMERADGAKVLEWAAGHPGATVVASPGIAPSDPAIAAARRAGLEVRGELCLGCSLLPPSARVVAVTGSKGKSSLVKLLADALSASGRVAVPCGNYGRAVCDVADSAEPVQDAIVECSSFQLETADEALAPDVAILLNLSSDHLDRHGSLGAYLDAKLAVFANLKAGGVALVPAPSEDPSGIAAAFKARFPGRAFSTFGSGPDADFRAEVPSGSYFDSSVLRPAAAAAFAALERLGLGRERILAALESFEPLPHRMQTVLRRGLVAWVDNSKATSLAALVASLEMAKRPILLLAGGRLKEPLSVPGGVLREKGVEKAYLFGECGGEMARKWGTEIPVAQFENLADATAAATFDAAAMDVGTVLLAPGTASFDQFSSYAERGNLFCSVAAERAGAAVPPHRP